MLFIFSIFGLSYGIKDSQCPGSLASCSPPASYSDSSSPVTIAGVAAVTPVLLDVNFIAPVQPINVPNPNEFDRLDVNGNFQFMSSSGSMNGNTMSFTDFSAMQGITTSTPPPFSTVAIAYKNPPVFLSNYSLFNYTADLRAVDQLNADGTFMRELRRRLGS
jgi:hypothetical protein